MKFSTLFFTFCILSILGIIGLGFLSNPIWYLLILFIPLFLLGLYDYFQPRHAILRNFPVLGRMRYLLENFRPELMQYFIETDTEGSPINRIDRSVIYQRAKQTIDTTPFGTRLDVNLEGYEFMKHSIYPYNHDDLDFNPRIVIGEKHSNQPYSASIFNISAMSFGSLSQNAVMAMNKGAKMGRFAQNTGEGGISPYHFKYGGDLIWQIGTGYFGARNDEGNFDFEIYKQNAMRPEVKMVELKLSQGAKPGHGGILPAKKNTPEIAKIRNIKPHTAVLSPPRHSAFGNPTEMMYFIKKLRDESGGKPVGFKLCVGDQEEFEDICKAMIKENIFPDFIAVDGGEGGTGAAPVEFSNYVGMPLTEGLIFVDRCLKKYNIRKETKIIAAGKIFSGFQIAKVLALGADLCYSARAMMVAVGCIQALECNTNTCPTGVATQDKRLIRGLEVGDKSERIKNYHNKTVHTFVELMGAAGLSTTDDLEKKHIFRRISPSEIRSYEEIYPE